jgi:hypothetical protein
MDEADGRDKAASCSRAGVQQQEQCVSVIASSGPAALSIEGARPEPGALDAVLTPPQRVAGGEGLSAAPKALQEQEQAGSQQGVDAAASPWWGAPSSGQVEVHEEYQKRAGPSISSRGQQEEVQRLQVYSCFCSAFDLPGSESV